MKRISGFIILPSSHPKIETPNFRLSGRQSSYRWLKKILGRVRNSSIPGNKDYSYTKAFRIFRKYHTEYFKQSRAKQGLKQRRLGLVR